MQQDAPFFSNAGSRAAAWAIDASVCMTLMGVVVLACRGLGVAPRFAVFLGAWLGMGFLYAPVMRSLFQGTGGELALELRAVTRRGEPLNLPRATLRLGLGIGLPFAVPVAICWLQYLSWRDKYPESEGFDGLELLFIWFVTWIVVVPIWSALQIGLASSGSRRAIPDLLCGTTVTSVKQAWSAPGAEAVVVEAAPKGSPEVIAAPASPRPSPRMVLPISDGGQQAVAGFGDRFGAAVPEVLVFCVAFSMASWPWNYLPVFLLGAFAIEASLAGCGWHSPGKLVVGTQVVDVSGAAATLRQLVIRAAARWSLPLLAFGLGMANQVIGQAIDEHTLADLSAREFAGGWITLIAWTIAHMVITGASGRAVHDRIAKTSVVKRRRLAAVPPLPTER